MLLKITSAKSPIVQNFIKANKDKKFRHEFGGYLVEGIRMVRDAVRFGCKIRSIFIDESKKEYIEEFSGCGINVYVAESYIIEKMCATVTPQGILASVEIVIPTLKAPTKTAVILDNIQDAGNAGSIMRTALAAGVTDVYFVNSVDPYNPKVVKSSMSTIFNLNIYIADSAAEILPLIKQSGIPILCADTAGENIFKVVPPEKFALVIGNEGAGVCREFIDNADHIMTIPMDMRVESLNAAASAAIIIYTLKKEI